MRATIHTISVVVIQKVLKLNWFCPIWYNQIYCVQDLVYVHMYCGNYIFIFHKQYSKKSLWFNLQFGSGSCSGDSGGPLVFNDKSSNPSRYRQIGIVQGSAGPCGNDIFPGIYARLDDYDVLNFIYKTAFGKNIDSFSSSGQNQNIVLATYYNIFQ